MQKSAMLHSPSAHTEPGEWGLMHAHRYMDAQVLRHVWHHKQEQAAEVTCTSMGSSSSSRAVCTTCTSAQSNHSGMESAACYIAGYGQMAGAASEASTSSRQVLLGSGSSRGPTTKGLRPEMASV